MDRRSFMKGVCGSVAGSAALVSPVVGHGAVTNQNKSKPKKMDVVQKHVFQKVSAFVNEKFEYLEMGQYEPWISLNQREAYIVLKLFENQKPPRRLSGIGG